MDDGQRHARQNLMIDMIYLATVQSNALEMDKKRDSTPSPLICHAYVMCWMHIKREQNEGNGRYRLGGFALHCRSLVIAGLDSLYLSGLLLYDDG